MSHYYCMTIICPFYKRDDKNLISCEGGKVFFPEASRCQQYLYDYCGTHEYWRCTIAQMLLKYYEDKEKDGEN